MGKRGTRTLDEKRAARRRQYAQWVAQGLCGKCGKPRVPRSVWCRKHAAAAAASAALQKTRRAAHKCYRCGDDRAPGSKLCSRHTAETQAQAQQAQAWRNAGLCGRCGQPPDGRYKLCREHRLNRVRKRARRRAKGLCELCPRPLVEGTVLCAEHHRTRSERAMRLRAAWREKGLCMRCGKSRAGGSDFWCAKHADSSIRADMRDLYVVRTAQRRAAGTCVACGEPAGLHWLCREHRAKSRTQQRAARQERFKKGLCTECGVQPYEHGYRRCIDCREWSRLRDKTKPRARRQSAATPSQRQTRRARLAGKCLACARPPEQGYRKCAKHLEAERLATRERRRLRRENGLCAECSAPAETGITLCAKHRATKASIDGARKRTRRQRTEFAKSLGITVPQPKQKERRAKAIDVGDDEQKLSGEAASVR